MDLEWLLTPKEVNSKISNKLEINLTLFSVMNLLKIYFVL